MKYSNRNVCPVCGGHITPCPVCNTKRGVIFKHLQDNIFELVAAKNIVLVGKYFLDSQLNQMLRDGVEVEIVTEQV